MISCEKASLICNKAQYDEATFMDKVKLKFHLMICKTCSTYTRKNTEFTTLCEKANMNSLSENEKTKMKEALKNKL